ncbi:MAG: hypothetical protein JO170_31505 [Verrucomicrobia bacterium]|nr:hypothetical protein [Verrucomicrobiota bacterium]
MMILPATAAGRYVTLVVTELAGVCRFAACELTSTLALMGFIQLLIKL